MLAILVTMGILVALSFAIAGVVVLGMVGHGKEQAPALARAAAKTARHLNGEAIAPAFVRREKVDAAA